MLFSVECCLLLRADETCADKDADEKIDELDEKPANAVGTSEQLKPSSVESSKSASPDRSATKSPSPVAPEPPVGRSSPPPNGPPRVPPASTLPIIEPVTIVPKSQEKALPAAKPSPRQKTAPVAAPPKKPQGVTYATGGSRRRVDLALMTCIPISKA